MPEPTRSAENAVLLAAAHIGCPPVPGLDGATLDWAYLRRAADAQGVTALLYEWLRHHPGLRVPAPVLDPLHEAYWQGHFRNRLLLEELRRVAAAATAEGLRVMPLKGAHLARRCYARPAQRPMSDLDLLTVPADVPRLGTLLARLGYAEVAHAPSYVDDARLDDDSRDHAWFAIRPGVDALIEYRVAPLELAVGRLTDLDPAYTDVLRQHAREVWVRGRSWPDAGMLEQSPEDLLLHVTTHMAAKHVHFRLIWLRDVAAILDQARELDWSYVVQRASALRVAAPVAAALDAARQHTGAVIPDAHMAAIIRTLGARWSLERRDLARLRAYGAGLPARDLGIDGPALWPLGAALSRVRGWRPRLRVLRWVLLPGREYLAHRGTDAPGPARGLRGSVRRLVLRRRG